MRADPRRFVMDDVHNVRASAMSEFVEQPQVFLRIIALLARATAAGESLDRAV